MTVFGVSEDFPMKEAVLSSMGHISRENKTEDLELPLMEFDDIATATDNFSDANKLGQGCFGIVYDVPQSTDHYMEPAQHGVRTF